MKVQNTFSPFMVSRGAGQSPRTGNAVAAVRLPGQSGHENSSEIKSKKPQLSGESLAGPAYGNAAAQPDSRTGSPVSGAPAGLSGQQKQQTGEPEKTSFAQKGPDGELLSRADHLLVAKLRRVDIAVRAHERAHLAAAGPYAKSAASFSYQRGPDGRDYAVGGEVAIDTSEEARPEQTISKMMVVRAAALAPADPSPQDRQVAAAASVKIVQANQELRVERVSEAKKKSGRGRQRH